MLKSKEMRESRARLINDRSAQFALPSMDLKIINSPLAQSGHQQTFQKFPGGTQSGTKSSWNSKGGMRSQREVSPQSQRFISQKSQTKEAASTAAMAARAEDEERKEEADRYCGVTTTPERTKNEQFRDSNNQTDLPEPVDYQNQVSVDQSI